MLSRKKYIIIFLLLLTGGISLCIYSNNKVYTEQEALAYNSKGVILLREGNAEEALILFDKASHTAIPQVEFYFNKGLALGTLKRYKEELDAYNKALTLSTQNLQIFIKIFINKANALFALKKYKESLAYCKMALQLTTKDPILYNGTGAVLGALKRYAEAVDSYNKAIELKPDYVEPHANKACPLYNLGRYEEAVKACNKAIELDPGYVGINQIYIIKAKALNKLERYKEAIDSAEKALKLNPQSKEALEVKEIAANKLGLI